MELIGESDEEEKAGDAFHYGCEDGLCPLCCSGQAHDALARLMREVWSSGDVPALVIKLGKYGFTDSEVGQLLTHAELHMSVAEVLSGLVENQPKDLCRSGLDILAKSLFGRTSGEVRQQAA